MTQLVLNSHAKINLWLRVMGRRDDGFHDVTTRMCRLALADQVTVAKLEGEPRLELTCSDPLVPVDESNLAARALRSFQQRTGEQGAWRIHLEKVIPAGAGLGGGSSNAAAVLRAVNELCGHPLDHNTLVDMAGQLGADVAFFVLFALAGDGTGKGEKVVAVDFPWRLPMVLVKPPFPISTPWAYQRWLGSKPTRGAMNVPQVCPWGVMENDLERPVFETHLFLAALKNWLLEQSEVVAALMSGSGSTVFAITRHGSGATELVPKVQQWCGETSWVRATVAGPI
ncbi:MAG: 4-(cytidine 5'-diphospho)-2-C-methyl-D-erythritol kinase [Verrucomicrobiales bacterium]|nr:4-(cytidine 5'-diphospho)-2-C-methyl-D-erythritol kinase [Verrucomicrobiales bacterium]